MTGWTSGTGGRFSNRDILWLTEDMEIFCVLWKSRFWPEVKNVFSWGCFNVPGHTSRVNVSVMAQDSCFRYAIHHKMTSDILRTIPNSFRKQAWALHHPDPATWRQPSTCSYSSPPWEPVSGSNTYGWITRIVSAYHCALDSFKRRWEKGWKEKTQE